MATNIYNAADAFEIGRIMLGIENASQQYTIIATDGNGAVNIVSGAENETYTHTAPAVGLASAQLVAANTARKYLLIQNQDAANSIWIRFGAAATAGAGSIEIAAGAQYILDNRVSGQVVNAIALVANANITVVEGV